MKENIILSKTFDFALKVVDLYKYLTAEKRELILSKQLLRSGTSIGANVREANLSITKKEFVAKAQVALKEASETEYWLLLLTQSGYLTIEECPMSEVKEILRILTAIIKTAKGS